MQPIMWTPGMSLEVMEKLIIKRAFEFYRNNKTQTANSLGISIRTLDAKLEKYQKEADELEKSAAEARERVASFHKRQLGQPQYATAEKNAKNIPDLGDSAAPNEVPKQFETVKASDAWAEEPKELKLAGRKGK